MSKTLCVYTEASTFFFALFFYNILMYYELYMDLFFLENFMMDYILLLLVSKILGKGTGQGRILIGGVLGSALTCITVVIPVPYTVIKVLICHGVINGVMIFIGLKIRDIRTFARALILLYIGGFLMGGVMSFLRVYIKAGSLLFALSLAGYYVSLGAWKFLSALCKWRSLRCKVVLLINGKEFAFRGFLDTGNALRDPQTNLPVSILGRGGAAKLENEDIKLKGYVPYCTIGNEWDALPVFQADEMRVLGSKEYRIRHPIIGVSPKWNHTKEGYELILNPNLF